MCVRGQHYQFNCIALGVSREERGPPAQPSASVRELSLGGGSGASPGMIRLAWHLDDFGTGAAPLAQVPPLPDLRGRRRGGIRRLGMASSIRHVFRSHWGRISWETIDMSRMRCQRCLSATWAGQPVCQYEMCPGPCRVACGLFSGPCRSRPTRSSRPGCQMGASRAGRACNPCGMMIFSQANQADQWADGSGSERLSRGAVSQSTPPAARQVTTAAGPSPPVAQDADACRRSPPPT